MGLPYIPGAPGWSVTPPATAFGTALTTLIPPFPGPKEGSPLLYALTSNQKPNWWGSFFTHITSAICQCGSTQNIQYFMRPLNWTTIKTAMPKNTTAVVLTDDPGIYSTNYRYPMAGQAFNPPGTANTQGPTLVADDSIAATDIVAYQLDDGSWQLDTIASGTFVGANLVLTTGTPNRTGCTIAAGRPIFWFGIFSEPHPSNGLAHMLVPPTVSATTNLVGDYNGAGFTALNAGDPLVHYNPNATATTFVSLFGDYRAY